MFGLREGILKLEVQMGSLFIYVVVKSINMGRRKWIKLEDNIENQKSFCFRLGSEDYPCLSEDEYV